MQREVTRALEVSPISSLDENDSRFQGPVVIQVVCSQLEFHIVRCQIPRSHFISFAKNLTNKLAHWLILCNTFTCRIV